jgi:hypothetical protein
MSMGVSRSLEVTFDKSKSEELLKLVKELFDKQGDSRFHWGESFDEDMSLEEVFEEWRYELEEAGDKYKVAYFNGEKEGDDSKFWEAIASVIDSGSEIESTTEVGDHYKWIFKDGTFKEEWGDVVYE